MRRVRTLGDLRAAFEGLPDDSPLDLGLALGDVEVFCREARAGADFDEFASVAWARLEVVARPEDVARDGDAMSLLERAAPDGAGYGRE